MAVEYNGKKMAMRAEVNASGGINVVQETGQSTTDVMSQKAVTDALGSKASTSSVENKQDRNHDFVYSATRGYKVGDIVYSDKDYNGATITDIDGAFFRCKTEYGGIINFSTWVFLDYFEKVGEYDLPVASSTVLGGVKPSAKTATETQEVKVDSNGKLWTNPLKLPFDDWDGFGASGSLVLPSGGWYYITNVPGSGILYQAESSWSTKAQIFEIDTASDKITAIETSYSSSTGIVLKAKEKVGTGAWTGVTTSFYYKKI